MSLFLETAGLSDIAFANLFTISGQDGGLGSNTVGGGLDQVTYTLTAGQPATATQLNTLVNTNFGVPIVITALNGGTDPHTGQNVTGNGFTFTDTSSGSPVIRVVYDVSQCCGAGLAAFDTGHNHITSPNPVILYHELSHALRRANGTTQTNDEIPAETDENVMRGVLGLCLRDVNNHDADCAGGNNCGGSDGGIGLPPSAGCGSSGGDGCFVVTAATGSAQSIEIVRLRRLRDEIATTSGMAAQLIDAIYREYYQFSPGFAARIRESAVARRLVLAIVVEPLLAWYTLAATLALRRSDRRAVAESTDAIRAACGSRAGKLLVATLRRLLRRRLARVPLAAWAIADPLARVWAHANTSADLHQQVAQWLTSAPLDRMTPPRCGPALERELGVLFAFCAFNPAACADLKARATALWPAATAVSARPDLF